MRERSNLKGPRSLDSSLPLREDYYGFTYLYMMKRATIFGDDGSDSDPGKKEEDEALAKSFGYSMRSSAKESEGDDNSDEGK